MNAGIFQEKIASLTRRGLFPPLPAHFATILARRCGDPERRERVFAAAFVLAYRDAMGRHACLELDDPTLLPATLADLLAGLLEDGSERRLDHIAQALGLEAGDAAGLAPETLKPQIQACLQGIRFPAGWGDAAQLDFVAVPGTDVNRPQPFVLDGGRLYLHRNWICECRIAGRLCELAAGNGTGSPLAKFRAAISPYFQKNTQSPDWQQIAAAAALRNQFTVITGGPGTGKTTTTAAILGLALEANPGLNIILCAPTGKAQAVLAGAIRDEGNRLELAPEIKARLAGLGASTIHRLLKFNPASGGFSRNRKSPLTCGLVVVDEVSMIPLQLMHDLLEAIPAGARLIFLGDKDQLPAIETGTILTDLFAAGTATVNRFSAPFLAAAGNACFNPAGMGGKLEEARPASRVSDAIIQLQTSHRFDDLTPFGRVVQAINAGKAAAAWENLISGEAPEGKTAIAHQPLPATVQAFQARLQEAIRQSPYHDLRTAEDLPTAYARLGNFRVLCSHRNGPFGVTLVNRAVRQALGLIHDYQKGSAILITANDYANDLFNGDIGLCWPDEENGIRVFFPDPAVPGQFRPFRPQELPEHEDAFAMTIHKSQGSGFTEILVILPDRDSPLLTRELLYTGLTRAKQKATLWANEPIFYAAIARQTLRASGLAKRLQ
jgi:exodeoxyribonuclease V alpha subunit